MVDKEKVLKGLECCSKSISKACPMECPYRVECLMQDDKLYMYSVMHDALELMKEPPQWISVDDRMPPDDQMVIGYTPVDGYMFIGFHKIHKYSLKDASYSYSYWYIITSMRSTKHMHKKVTHWMPLPEPPKEVKQDG